MNNCPKEHILQPQAMEKCLLPVDIRHPVDYNKLKRFP